MGKFVLIITDGAEQTQRTARAIAAALKQYKVTVVSAGDFEGTALLAADICFFGAEVPNPSSFSGLYKMLEHINLAGRSCGLFAGSKEAAEYLSDMVRPSELKLPAPFLGEGDIAAWAGEVERGGYGGV